ncbi:hypothetical protein F5Y00DRAFT_263942 [Daldinia vernicosa]|uniref:uncharacterized protein n=1 Tax=Daldinia vernicosa TaxID=114800 RepID=UPI00200720F5|nr:uncharacterized protein F5Y00DRAFT_263942 [Daldinia vernicosa]KAI0847129.1 hypothetical protein F5Y00DRAFT_263942 [Daldinia vernicosa]
MGSFELKPTISEKCTCHSIVPVTTWGGGQRSENSIRTRDLIPFETEMTKWPFDPEDDIIFMVVKANDVRNCVVCGEIFIDKFRMPQFWWTDTYKRMNGYFGSEFERNADGVIETYSTWSRALIKHSEALHKSETHHELQYRWLKLNIFTRWFMGGKMMIIAFDPVETMQEKLRELFLSRLDKEDLQDPYWPYEYILEELVSLQGSAIWSLRDLIRTIELSPTRDPRTLREKPQYNYSRMHDIARHAIHVSETLDLAVKLSEDLIQEHQKLIISSSDGKPRLETDKTQSLKQVYSNTHSRLVFFSHALFSLRCRSSSNHQRLGNEIQLRFHTDSQYDSQVSVEISHSAKSDGASMRWIAIVSLIFLPANLVSSVFSTTFFETTNGMISVTNDFWIYWVALVAVTVMTLALWFCLSRFSIQVGGMPFRRFTVWQKTERPLEYSTHCAV